MRLQSVRSDRWMSMGREVSWQRFFLADAALTSPVRPPPKTGRLLLIFVASIAFAFGANGANANSLEWSADGTTPGGTGIWNTSTARWFNGSTFQNWDNITLDDAVFDGTTGTVTLDVPITANSLTFSLAIESSGSTVTGNTLTLGGVSPFVSVALGRSATIASVLDGAAGLTKTGDGALILSGANTFMGPLAIDAGTLEVQNGAAVADSAAVTVTSPGLFQVTDSETIGSLAGSGGTTIAAAQTLTTGGNDDSTVYSGAISGAGALTKEGIGTMTLSGTNTFMGPLAIDAGTLEVQNGAAVADSAAVTVTSPGLFQVTDSETIGSLAGSGGTTIAAAQTLTTGGNDDSTVYSGAISGAGALTKEGIGTMTLSGTNTFMGPLAIDAGTLEVQNGAAVADSAAVTVTSPGLFQVTDSETIGSLAGSGGTTIAAAQTLTTGGNDDSTVYSGAISGAGALTKEGIGTMTLSGTNTFMGPLAIDAGTLEVQNGAAVADSAAVTVTSPGLFQVTDSETIGSLAGSGGTTIAAAQTLTTGGNDDSTVYSGAISGAGALTKEGIGTMTLSGTNTFMGPLAIDAGTLEVQNGAAVADSAAVTVTSPGLFQVTDSETIGSLAGSGGTTIAAAQTLTTGGNDDSTVYSGAISGAGALTKEGIGTMTLSGTNTFMGPLAIDAGTLEVQNGAAVADSAAVTVTSPGLFQVTDSETIGSLAGSGGTTIAAAQTLTTGGNDDSTVYSGAISGAGALTKEGIGTMTLSGTNTFMGPLAIDAGTLEVQNGAAVADSAAVTVTSPGLFQVTDSETIGSLAGSGGTTIAAAQTLTTGGNDDSTVYSGAISGAGALTKEGIGTMTLSGTNTFMGPLAIDAGTLEVQNGAAVADSAAVTVTSPGLFQVTDSETIGSLAGSGGTTIAAAQTLTTGGNDDSTVYSGAISGAGALTKEGIGTMTLSGTNTFMGPLAIDAGTLEVQNGAAVADSAAVTVTSPGLFQVTDSETIGSLAGSGGTTIAAAQTLTTGGNDDSTVYSGAISGAGALTKEGIGTMTLSGTNTFMGPLAIDAGTLEVQNGAAVADSAAVTVTSPGLFQVTDSETIGSLAGSGGTTIAAAQTLTTGGNDDSTVYSGAISGAGALTKEGIGTMTLSGTNTFMGPLAIDAGTLEVQNGAAVADSAAVTVTSPGLFQVTDSETIGSLAGSGGTTIAAAQTLTTGGNDDSTVYSGAISGAGALTKEGIGTMTLSGTNTFMGPLAIDAGTLEVQNGAAVADSAAVTVTSPGLFQVTDSETIGSLAGSGGTTIAAAQTLTTGGNDDSTVYSGAISGAGALTKEGIGTMTLSGTNTFMGPLAIDAGTLEVQNGAAVADSAAVTVTSPGLFQVTDSETIGSLAGSGGTTIAAAQTLTTGGNDDSTVYSGAISGAGALTKEGIGTMTLSGTNTFMGPLAIDAGTLEVQNGAAVADSAAVTVTSPGLFQVTDSETIRSLAGSGGTTIAAAQTLTTGGNDDSTVYSGAISGAGALTKEGIGTMTLSGTSDYSGATIVSAGMLAVNGTIISEVTVQNGGTLGGAGNVGAVEVLSGGTFAPGNSIGTMTVNGAFNLDAGAIYEVEVNAAGQGDQVKVNGTVNLTGSVLRVLAENGSYNPSTSYVIVDNDDVDPVTGMFSTVTTNLAFLTPTVVYNGGTGNDVVLTLVRNDTSFEEIAQTPNEVSVAKVVSPCAADDVLCLALLNLTAEQAATGLRCGIRRDPRDRPGLTRRRQPLCARVGLGTLDPSDLHQQRWSAWLAWRKRPKGRLARQPSHGARL